MVSKLLCMAVNRYIAEIVPTLQAQFGICSPYLDAGSQKSGWQDLAPPSLCVEWRLVLG